jgi:hypothetical protein
MERRSANTWAETWARTQSFKSILDWWLAIQWISESSATENASVLGPDHLKTHYEVGFQLRNVFSNGSLIEGRYCFSGPHSEFPIQVATMHKGDPDRDSGIRGSYK